MYGHNSPTFPGADHCYLLNLGGDGSQLQTGGGDQFVGMEMGSPSSLASYGGGNTTHHGPSYMQRSGSSQSLERNINGFSSSSGSCSHFASAFHEYLDLDSACSFRRVLSTGDLEHGHHRAESPLSSESSVIIESMNRATKYSPEEKKERIERYKTKRTQRNFNKKIKYECRKTLADSRPRIRGRFARNDEIDQKNSQLQWSNTSLEEDEEDDDAWISTFLDPFSANSMV